MLGISKGSAQVRAATAQVQRQKWTLVGPIVVRDFRGSNSHYSDSETVEDHQGASSSGVFPKIAGVGLDVLSAFV